MKQATGGKFKAAFVITSGLFLAAGYGLLFFATREDPAAHAIISMGGGLILLWVLFIGGILFTLRNQLRSFVHKIPIHWQLKFILFCVLLAMTEEAIAVSMTNLAPFFGVEIGQAYITASTNYLDVILHHSVVIFIPMFCTWAWMLQKYTFSPFWVFLLFGMNGLIGEALAFGAQNPISAVMWIFVYGLMVYLPAYTIPQERGAAPAKPTHGLMAMLLPVLTTIPWALLLRLLLPGHPDIHFPPL